MAVAAMILAAISLLVISRFGSVSNLTNQAEQKAESLVSEGQRKINSTGAMALSGFQRVSYLFNGPNVKDTKSAPARTRPDAHRAQPAPRPQHDPTPNLAPNPAPAERDKHQK
jgi:hypothetical protein